MKYLFNIALLSIFLFAVGCQEDEQDILALEREAFISNNDFSKTSDKDNEFSGKPNPEMLIKFLDKDQDGRISHEEAGNAKRQQLFENFGMLDGNNDGFIDEEEITKLSAMVKTMKGGKPNPEMLIKFLDKDQDGKISREEVGNAKKQQLSENFGMLDSNNDGFIDEGEVTKLAAMVKGMKAGKPNPEMLFKFLDRNQDGMISQEEAGRARKKKMSENFDLIDTNSDGFIAEEEMKDFFKMKR